MLLIKFTIIHNSMYCNYFDYVVNIDFFNLKPASGFITLLAQCTIFTVPPPSGEALGQESNPDHCPLDHHAIDDYLQGGHVVESGSHEALLQAGGLYSKLWNSSTTQRHICATLPYLSPTYILQLYSKIYSHLAQQKPCFCFVFRLLF